MDSIVADEPISAKALLLTHGVADDDTVKSAEVFDCSKARGIPLPDHFMCAESTIYKATVNALCIALVSKINLAETE
eukprot:IDg18192t1